MTSSQNTRHTRNTNSTDSTDSTGGTLTFADHGEAIGNAVAVTRNNLAAAGLHARVPTTPGWTAESLLQHSGVICRWVTDVLQGASGPPEAERLTATYGEFGDPFDWLEDACVEMLNELVATPKDATPWRLVATGPVVARESWARFAAHELLVHAIDAMAARLQRPPTVAELWISPQLAMDGLDHLLRGLVPLRADTRRSEQTRVVAVLPDDAEAAVAAAHEASDSDLSDLARGWTLTLGPAGAYVRLGVDQPGDEGATADLVLRGPAVAVLAALWNRGDEAVADGDAELYTLLRDLLRV